MINGTDSTARLRGVVSSLGASFFARLMVFPLTAAAALGNSSIILSVHGAPMFAVYAVATTPLQLIQFMDLGMGAGVINAISTTRENDQARIATLVTATKLLSISTLAVILLAGLTLITGSWADLFGVGEYGIPDLDLLIAISIATLSLCIPLGLGQRVLVGLGRNPAVVASGAIAPSITLAATGVLCATGAPPAYLIASPALGALVSSLMLYIWACRSLNFRARRLFTFTGTPVRSLVSQGIAYLILSVASMLPFQLARVFLARNNTVEAVAQFSLANQFYLPTWSFISATGVALWPIYARSRSAGRFEPVFVYKIAAGFAVSSIVSGGLLVLLGPRLASVVSDGEVRPDREIFLAAAFLLLSQAGQFALGVSLTSPRDLWFQARWASAGAVAALAGLTVTSSYAALTPYLVIAITVVVFQLLPNLGRLEQMRIRLSRHEGSVRP
ncbi:oligosaccharide flippase family protein [Nocardioides sp. SOB77]|uniref:Oligosaccharide flippase family protein n=1 Tax=Nocardioides oceani TaxID=3058369 RepID=A0ABT8FIK1_9ACTN|nr:oligosaccharide flippase family protein [Nocardioides oceani]MDN4174514.1 oligosaccharide flippase family protein [Nocardioides oceani]